MEDDVNSVQWGEYSEFKVISPIPAREDSREGARDQYDNWLAQKAERIREIDALLKLNSLPRPTTDQSIQKVTDWFIANVEARKPPIEGAPGLLTDRWYSVCNDLGTLLGDVMIDRAPSLRWSFFIPAETGLVQYQKPVVYGFTLGNGVVDENLAFDPIGTCVQIGQRVVLGSPMLDRNRRFMLHELELAMRYA